MASARTRTKRYLFMIFGIVALALHAIPDGRETGIVAYFRQQAVGTFAICPYVLILMAYALVPFWRPPERADFIRAGGIGIGGLLWTALIFAH